MAILFREMIIEKGSALRECIDVIDFYVIDYLAQGTENRFVSWQKELDVTIGISVPFGEENQDNYVMTDEDGNKFDPWDGRRIKLEGDWAVLPYNIELTFVTPSNESIAIEWKGSFEFRIKDQQAFNERWDDEFICSYLFTEVLAQELWPMIRQTTFQQFDTWRLPRPELPWSKPNLQWEEKPEGWIKSGNLP